MNGNSYLASLVLLLPVKWQNYAKGIAATVLTVAAAVMPILALVGVDIPTGVSATIATILALLVPVSVIALPNIPKELVQSSEPTDIPLAQD